MAYDGSDGNRSVKENVGVQSLLKLLLSGMLVARNYFQTRRGQRRSDFPFKLATRDIGNHTWLMPSLREMKHT